MSDVFVRRADAPQEPSASPATTEDPPVAFGVYDAATGRLKRHGHVMRSALEDQPLAAGETIEQITRMLPGFDRLTVKANGVDAATLKLPAGGFVLIDDVAHQVEAGPFSFSAEMPGTYRIRVELPSYWPLAVEIVAS